jgi:hypothetical protein
LRSIYFNDSWHSEHIFLDTKSFSGVFLVFLVAVKIGILPIMVGAVLKHKHRRFG